MGRPISSISSIASLVADAEAGCQFLLRLQGRIRGFLSPADVGLLSAASTPAALAGLWPGAGPVFLLPLPDPVRNLA